MQASQPIRPSKSPTDGHLTAIGLLVALGIVVAIIKPWGSSPGAAAVPPPPPTPSPTATAKPSPDLGFGGRDYDPSIFGEHEPEAVWGIWPAGFLTTFGFVIQVPATPAPLASSGARGGVSPRPTLLAGPGGSASLPGDDVGPSWPARLDMPDGDHLLLIGVNMPPGFSMSLERLEQTATDGSQAAVGIVRLKSPWPDHFAVIGMGTPADDGHLIVWPPGTYQLELSFEPGGINRTIEISIGGPPAGP